MIQIALCDDNRAHIAKLEALLNEYFEGHPDIPIKIKARLQPLLKTYPTTVATKAFL